MFPSGVFCFALVLNVEFCLVVTLAVVIGHFCFEDNNRLVRHGLFAAGVIRKTYGEEIVDDLHALCDLTECGILSVEVGMLIVIDDKELGRCAVHIGRSCH